MEQSFCLIGKVVKPHGIRGKIKVDYFGESLDRFPLHRKVLIKDSLGRPESYEVLEVTLQPPRLILRLKGIDRVEETESLIGKEVFIRKEDLPEPLEGEYYWFEILGMAVETERGGRIGTVKEIFPTGANDVYVVQGKRREILLPATEEVVRSIDRETRVIKVVRMEGLWEDEDEI
jgi:16S rRNA processing protein RimM